MKNYHLLAAVALIAMAGCSQNEITDVSPDANPVVGFDIYTGGQTKGTITDGTSIQIDNFGILAYYTGQEVWASKIGSTTPNFMWNQQVTYSGGWTYTPVKYWPNTKDDKVSFFAYAPYSSNGTSDKGIKLSTNTTATKPTIEFTLASNPTEMVDLVAGFQKDQEKRTAAVSFELKHLLSRVEFKAKLDAGIDGSTHVFITNMRILGKEANGDGANQAAANSSSKFYEKATYDWSAERWESPTSKDALYLITGVLNTSVASAGGYTGTSVEVTGTEEASPTKLFKENEYLFLIPPANETGISSANDVRVQVDYDIVTVDGQVSGGHTKTSTMATVSLNNGTLIKGKAYEYILTIGLTKVEVEASVTDWETPDNVTIPSVVVATASTDAIIAAIGELNTIKLDNTNCNYFVVNIADVYSVGALNLSSATVANFMSGDKIELNFKTASTTGVVTAPSGWTATSALAGSIGKVILTKN